MSLVAGKVGRIMEALTMTELASNITVERDICAHTEVWVGFSDLRWEVVV